MLSRRRGRGEDIVWGDGYASDSLAYLSNVRSWDQCERDEMLRLFPQLAARSVRLPEPLRDQLLLQAESLKCRPRTNQHWITAWRARFADNLRMDELAGRRQRAAARICDVVNAFDRRRDLDYSEQIASDIAYWAGVHPAYLWPEAFISHDIYTALGWLGHAERKGRAFLPVDIAEFFGDAIGVDGDGAVFIADFRIKEYVSDGGVLRALHDAARRRLNGSDEVFAFYSTRSSYKNGRLQ